MAFTCPRCGTSSQSPTDEAEGYCAVCHDVTGDEPPRMGLLPHLTVAELRVQLEALALARRDWEENLDLVRADQTIAAINERISVARSLETANAEAIYGAMAQAPTDTLRLIADLRRRLEAMPLRMPPGSRPASGLSMFGRQLEAMEQFVVDHLRARTAQMELDAALPAALAPPAVQPALGDMGGFSVVPPPLVAVGDVVGTGINHVQTLQVGDDEFPVAGWTGPLAVGTRYEAAACLVCKVAAVGEDLQAFRDDHAHGT